MNQNLINRINQSSFLNQLEKQQITFKNFLASLKRFFYKDFLSIPQNSTINDHKNNKNIHQASQNNFRINFIKNQLKQTNSKKGERNRGLLKVNQKFFSQSKPTSKQNSQVTNRNHLLSQRYNKNYLKSDMSLLNNFSNQYKIAQKISSICQSNLKIQPISSVTWNPDSKEFMTKLQNQKTLPGSSQTCSFLVELLNLNISTMVNFLQSQTQTIRNFNQIQAKTFSDLFKKIVLTQKFRSIQEPLIKKYKNCIFYGQKPNFDSFHCGIILYFNGNAYFGSMKNFQKHGLGIEFDYCQNISEKTYRLPNLDSKKSDYVIFRGNFYKNSKSGQFLIHASDYIYQGLILKGLFHGNGTLVTQISVFKGVWSLNKKISGSQTFKSLQMIYEGEYLDERFHGKGKLRNKDQFFQGEFQNGLKHGKGILVNKDIIYEGRFEKGKKKGDGIIFDKNEYAQLNPESDSKELDFQVCIYKVKFENDELISKSQFRNSKSLDEESLKTLQEENSICETFTIDFENMRPSKMLSKYQKEKLPEKRGLEKLNQQTRNQSQFLSFIPRQPQEEQLQRQKKRSYLLGNKFSRFPARAIKQID